jgi:hypothetical protein
MKSLWFAAALAATTASAEQVGLDASGSQLAFDVGAGSVDEVGAWLDTVSFADLKRSFAKHVIDGAALREITEEELKELGVKKVGCAARGTRGARARSAARPARRARGPR